MPLRLQCFFLRLLKYDFQLQFLSGKQLVLADMLSRASVGSPEKDGVYEDVEIHVVREAMQDRLARETRKDGYLKNVVEQLAKNKRVEGELRPFVGELSVINGVFLNGNKVVIPLSMRREMLRRIHDDHMGINKCKARARHLVFWPGLYSDIENVIAGCAVCQK